MFGKKKSKAPQSAAALMQDALSDLQRDQTRKEKRRNRRSFGLPAWVDRRILIGLAILFIGVVSDAVRRENQEFSATLTNMGGQVMAKASDTDSYRMVVLKQKLADRSTISTGPGAWAELSFPDGSKVVMDAGTEMKIKLLEYSRGGQWRSRSFFLNAGRIFTRIGENFGHNSQLRVYTPACVAAARGTRFSVTADPAANAARTVCSDGTVEVQGFNGARMYVGQTGDSTATAGQSPSLPVAAPAADLSGFRSASLNEVIAPDPWYKLAELTLTQTLNAPLTLLGVGKCSWWAGSLDAARRSACEDALGKIRINLEGDTSYPLWVNPATLAELSIKEPGGVDHILRNFDGAAIETYRSDGQRFYISARARDRGRTRYELDQSMIRRADNQD